MPNAALTLNSDRYNRLWSAINQIPDDILTDYLADNIIDEQEIEDITLRLESHLTSLNITDEDHVTIRRMVRHAVEYIRQQQQVGGSIEGKLCAATLSDIRSAMGKLVNSGQIALGVADAGREGQFSPNEGIPDERPEDYDETKENLLDS